MTFVAFLKDCNPYERKLTVKSDVTVNYMKTLISVDF